MSKHLSRRTTERSEHISSELTTEPVDVQEPPPLDEDIRGTWNSLKLTGSPRELVVQTFTDPGVFPDDRASRFDDFSMFVRELRTLANPRLCATAYLLWNIVCQAIKSSSCQRLEEILDGYRTELANDFQRWMATIQDSGTPPPHQMMEFVYICLRRGWGEASAVPEFYLCQAMYFAWHRKLLDDIPASCRQRFNSGFPAWFKVQLSSCPELSRGAENLHRFARECRSRQWVEQASIARLPLDDKDWLDSDEQADETSDWAERMRAASTAHEQQAKVLRDAHAQRRIHSIRMRIERMPSDVQQLRQCMRLWKYVGLWSSRWNRHRPSDRWQLSDPVFREMRVLYGSVTQSLCQSKVWRSDQVNFALRAWTVFADAPLLLPKECRMRLREEANKVLGHVRTLLKACDLDAFKAIDKLRQDAMSVLAFIPPDDQESGYLWKLLQPSTLALRALQQPGVAKDLRWWSEPIRDDVYGDREWFRWQSIAAELVEWFHRLAQREQADDPELLQLRRDFSQFCLDRLKLKKQKNRSPEATSESEASRPELVEADAIWRHAYVCAIEDLAVNPYGKGHKQLYQTSIHDPDPRVRQRAKRAMDLIQHHKLTGNPRRAVLQAFWRLRQAHRLALGFEIDPAGANRTRDQEVQRTTQPQNR